MACFTSGMPATLSGPGAAMHLLGVARGIGELVAEVNTYLVQESGKPRGAFLSTPKDGEDATIEQLKADTKTAQGSLLFVESMANNWESGGQPAGDWGVKHFGPSVGPGMVEVAKMARSEALGALGINEALFGGADSVQPLSEAWRLALFSLIAPLGHLVEAELQAKIDPGISLSWIGASRASRFGRDEQELSSLWSKPGCPVAGGYADCWLADGGLGRDNTRVCPTARPANHPRSDRPGPSPGPRRGLDFTLPATSETEIKVWAIDATRRLNGGGLLPDSPRIVILSATPTTRYGMRVPEDLEAPVSGVEVAFDDEAGVTVLTVTGRPTDRKALLHLRACLSPTLADFEPMQPCPRPVGPCSRCGSLWWHGYGKLPPRSVRQDMGSDGVTSAGRTFNRRGSPAAG